MAQRYRLNNDYYPALEVYGDYMMLISTTELESNGKLFNEKHPSILIRKCLAYDTIEIIVNNGFKYLVNFIPDACNMSRSELQRLLADYFTPSYPEICFKAPPNQPGAIAIVVLRDLISIITDKGYEISINSKTGSTIVRLNAFAGRDSEGIVRSNVWTIP
jgi:hypothetical protein